MCNFFNSCEESLHWGVWKFAKYVRNYVVFWKNLHSWQNFYTTAGRDGRDKFQVCILVALVTNMRYGCNATLLWKQGWGEQDRPPEQSWPRAGMSAYCHLFNSLGASCAGRFRWAFNQACSTTYHSAKCSWCKSSRWLSFGLRTPRRKAGRY